MLPSPVIWSNRRLLNGKAGEPVEEVAVDLCPRALGFEESERWCPALEPDGICANRRMPAIASKSAGDTASTRIQSCSANSNDRSVSAL